MSDTLAVLLDCAWKEMGKCGLTRFADCADGQADAATLTGLQETFSRISRLVDGSAVAPADCLMAASAAGLLPTAQPPGDLPDNASRNRFTLRHLERRDYRVRPARIEDVPALVWLEQRCWAAALRTPRAVLERRVRHYPQGQLVLAMDDAVVGVIYSQRIAHLDALNGATAAHIDERHHAEGKIVQLLAVNILPEVQHRNLGDQLLEFMLIRCSLQTDVNSVLAVTLCRSFEGGRGLSLEHYIRQRSELGVLVDPILRFHELHGATIERVMPGYRPDDGKNEGCGVLVSYDIHRRLRKELRLEPASAAGATVTRPTRSEIRRDVKACVCDLLGDGDKEAFSFDRPLMEMGLDSAALLALNEKIVQLCRLPLTPTFFFQYNTAEKVVGFLCDHAAVEPSGQPDRPDSASSMPGVADGVDDPAQEQDVAIVGMACRLPGGINTPDELWACLRSGTSVIGGLPAGRWEWPAEIDPVHKHPGIDRGGFLDDVAAFDAPHFRVSPAEAQSMDPQQRILLELCWHTLEHAGYAPAALAGSRTGVFIGASGSDYTRLLDLSRSAAEAHYGTGSSMAVLANRISYFYDLRGPSMVLDTACSSSLVAVHEAVQSIARGESSQALVGGINLILHPASSIAYYRAGMLSKDGQCRTFDQNANGYVRSEGAVMLLLKPLRSALASHDAIYAVIKGTACNHGGQASGLTVPNPEQQGHLLRAAWRSAAIDPRALGYIEAHGTGTSLGDPIEIQGIKHALAAFIEPHSARLPMACGLGSVKTNLGHLEAAAGLAGLLKAVLCLQHRELPASLHFRQLNEHIELSDRGLFVVDRLQPWKPPAEGRRRLTGISSFGSGGTNAHVVVAEYLSAEPAADVAAASEPVLFVLSARTAPQLKTYAQKFAEWLSTESAAAVSLGELAHQMQTGRQAADERLALVVGDRQELIRKLRAFCSSPVGDAFNGNALPAEIKTLTAGAPGQAFVQALVAERDLDKLALLWFSGVAVDWSLMYPAREAGNNRPRRIAAPLYPFARHAYWLPNADVWPGAAAVGASVSTTNQHPAPGEVAPTLLALVWRPIIDGNAAPAEIFPASGAKVLLIGASAQEHRAIASVYADVQSMDIDPAVTIDALIHQLNSFGDLDHIVWTAPPSHPTGVDTLIDQQNFGLLYLFKLVKALLSRSYGDRYLGWTVITRRTQAVFTQEIPQPGHAGIHGLIGALAKEFPRWSVRSLDLESEADWPVHEAVRLPVNQGEVLARRSGQWFRRSLSPIGRLPEASPAYRQNGVYVVIGGAGGIGSAWTRHVIDRYQAQVIWIGRRQADAAIAAKLAELAQAGPAPVYIAADAANPDSLQAAYAEIKRRWPAIHGVIHAAVGAFDRSIAAMDEQRFRDILSVKIDASIHLAEVFKAEPLDFILYFSSIVALEKTGGLSGYAAGGAFEDAFALHLCGRGGCPAKVMNWGHWDIGTGAVISDATKTRLQRSGFAPIQPDEAMAALQALLTAPLSQMALLKTSRPDLLPLVNMEQTLEIYADRIPRSIARLPPVPKRWAAQVETLKPSSLFNNAALETALLPLFACTLQSLGLLNRTDQVAPTGAAGFYRNWLEAGLRIIVKQGMAQIGSGDPARAWQDWEQAKRDRLGHADLSAAVDLVETCLRALPDILSGRIRATDVIFPGASMRRVEGIYRNNAVADYFNGLVAESLIAAIEVRLQDDRDLRLRILEIGAGTGSTTATVLPRLASYERHIAEYVYTDLSKAFLFHAEEQFVAHYPYVRPRLLDIEKPLAGQGLQTQHYDVVIATNVLHATRNIRQTLSNCKAALPNGGLLLLNEISSGSLFAHLTFGLLEGWWLSEDRPLRMPDAPGLYPTCWQEVLSQQGFATVVFPAPDAHVLGQQVIVAESDGIVVQKATPKPAERRGAAVGPGANGQRPASDEAAAPGRRRSDESLRVATNLHLKKLVAKTLRMDGDDIDVREPLQAYGIDSILVVQITDALRAVLPDVSSTLLFECQTIEALSDHFICNSRDRLVDILGVGAQMPSREPASPILAVSAPVGTAAIPSDVRGPHLTQQAIAVIGMSCRLPQADTVEDYWRILKSGQSCIREIPPDRWPLAGFFHADPDEAVQQGKSYSRWGGFLDGVTEFDPLFFNIAPKEAGAIDPQERLFLQTAWECLEDAGYTRERLAKAFRRQLGVFVGITRTGFDLFGPLLWQRGETVYPHTSFSSVANRLSYILNARGPSVPVDTMCSSSLTAIHQACQSLRSGECELAIAGGVNVYLHPSGYVSLSASGMLSRDGVCRSFGHGANGFVPGEGVAAVLLKPMSRAIADNDRIYATIRATHVNHGGKTNGYTVPNPQAQCELVRDALKKAGVNARAVSYIEAHGTGTELGDPIEVTGLAQAFRHFTPDTGFCALGSAKSNLGHLEAAAGIAGFIKVILQMRHGQLAPSLHAAELNPKIDFSKTPFVVQQTLADWQRPVLPQQDRACPRIAGISSFGAGGANAHVIVEEYCEPELAPPDEQHGCIIVLSARDEERLKAYAGKLHDFIAQAIADGVAPALPDLAYTLQVGREPMDHRLAMVVDSLGELRDKLNAYISGADVVGLHIANVRQHKEVIGTLADDETMQDAIAVWFRDGKYDRLLGLWTKGLSIDWARLRLSAAQRAPKVVSLPTYPFAKTRYWLPSTTSDSETSSGIAAGKMPTSQPQPESRPPDAAPAAVAKPNAIRLRDTGSLPTAFEAQASTRQRVLMPLHRSVAEANIGTTTSGSDVGVIDVHDLGDGIFAVRSDARDGPVTDIESACAALVACIGWVNTVAQTPDARAKVLLLEGLDRMVPGDAFPAAAPAIHHAVQALAGCTVPVIAVMAGENGAGAMLLAAACDMMICSAEGSYGFHSAALSELARRLFAERFGAAFTDALAATTNSLSGSSLRRVGFTMPVVAAAELEGFAHDIARSVARTSATVLTELKKQLTRRLAQAAEGLAVPSIVSDADEIAFRMHLGGAEADYAAAPVEQPLRVELESDVVMLAAYRNGVVIVKLCDRSSKNTSSPAFVRGVRAAFAHINGNPRYKAVVLTGYDHYFACGGTREGLLAIQSGEARFTDEQSYAMPLACEIPVIAAMQGHAIGAGWAMGLFCDWAVYSEESIYQSPYVLYGFTPGAGSTLIFPQRLGHDLSREILFTAREFQGRALKQRGIPMPVVPRHDVLDCALGLANRLAATSRQDLVQRKHRRSQAIRDQLQPVFAQELAMHDKTFVGNPDVITNIMRHFDQGARPGPDRPSKRDVPVQGVGARPAASRDVPTARQHADRLLPWLRETLAQELSIAPESLDGDVKFVDLGLDSVTAVTWIRAINKHYSLSIPATKVYSHPTLSEFHHYVLELGSQQDVFRTSAPLDGAASASPAIAATESTPARRPVLVRSFALTAAAPQLPAQPASALAPTPRAERSVPAEMHRRADPQAIAIIGMAGQFPKADTVNQFWRNLVEGRDCVADIPRARWTIDEYYDPDRNAPGKTVCRRMGVLDDVDVFDPLFFNISPSEAEYMDPQQRLFLQNSWHCIEDAGYDPADLSGTLCGVFVGCAASDYSQLLAGQPHSAQGLIGESVAMLPARIAYFLNLQGPCLAIDTACSASLVALASACDSLVLGNSDLALAGGVYIINGPDIHIKMSHAGMLSPDGRCFSFDQRANGFVPGEGVGVLLLKRLAQAERDGDDIYAVIRGWGVNQDGKTNGITAPNQESQIRLETSVYKQFGIDPGRIQLVEAHGTGTKLGDPIEVSALCEAFRQFTDRKHFCALGSVKSNIGHLATAAGVTGVIKSVLALKHQQLPPTINYQTLNEHIALGDSPFYVNTRCIPWHVDGPQKRLAAVSSFGFSGTNAHVVLEEAARPAGCASGQAEPSSAAVLLPLSARSRQQLVLYAQAVGDHLADESSGRNASLADIAFTFQTGRSAMSHRLAIVGSTVVELQTRLRDFAATGAIGPYCWAGEAAKADGRGSPRPSIGSGGEPPTMQDLTKQELAELAKRWIAGEAIPWASYYRTGEARRKHGLPTYPFAQERYWVPGSETAEVADEGSPGAASELSSRDSGPWRAAALPEAIDWRGQLQHCLARPILVAHADDSQGQAFRTLLAQLQQACGLESPATVTYCKLGDIKVALTAKLPDCLLVLGGTAHMSVAAPALVRCVEDAGDVATIVMLVEAAPAVADRLGRAIEGKIVANRQRYLLVSQPNMQDLGEALQRLVKEWIALGARARFVGLSEIHYAGAERLSRVGGAERGSDRPCLINKGWRAAPPEPLEYPPHRGTVLVLVNNESRPLADNVLDPADFKAIVMVADSSVPSDRIQNSVDFNDPNAARAGAQDLIDRHHDISHIIDLTDLHVVPQESDADPSGKAVFFQNLVASCNNLSILYVTRALQPFRSGRMSLAGAKFAGLVKMLSAEYRHVNARCIDIDEAAYHDPRQFRTILLQELGARLQETELCYREGQRFASVLTAMAADDGWQGAVPQIASDAVYVISGGTNGVGLEIAKYLAEQGCTRLVLMGITPLPAKTQWLQAVGRDDVSPYVRKKLHELIQLDNIVDHLEIYTGTLTDRHALRRYFMKIRSTLGPIRGVIHSAAVYSDADTPGFANKSLARMRHVWEPKIDGLESLHAVFKSDSLDFFVSFSSMTSLLPRLARGASDYAMANAFVEFFAAYQHHQYGNGRYKAITWSDWNQTGAITRIGAERAATVAETFDRLGMRTFSIREGRALFDLAMSRKAEGLVVVGYVDRSRFDLVRTDLLHAAPRDGEPEQRSEAVQPVSATEAISESSIVRHLERWEAEQRSGLDVSLQCIIDVISMEEIRELKPDLVHRMHALLFGSVPQNAAANEPLDYAQVISRTVMEVLKLKSLDPRQSFQNYGLDSISAMVLATRLEKRLKCEIQPRWLIEFPAVETLSRHLMAQHSNALPNCAE